MQYLSLISLGILLGLAGQVVLFAIESDAWKSWPVAIRLRYARTMGTLSIGAGIAAVLALALLYGPIEQQKILIANTEVDTFVLSPFFNFLEWISYKDTYSQLACS